MMNEIKLLRQTNAVEEIEERHMIEMRKLKAEK